MRIKIGKVIVTIVLTLIAMCGVQQKAFAQDKLEGDCYYRVTANEANWERIEITGFRKGVKNVVIPEKIEGIEVKQMFIDDGKGDDVETLHIPNTMTGDGLELWDRFCPKLKAFSVNKDHPYFLVKDGILYCDYDKNGKYVLHRYPVGKKKKVLRLSSSVEGISDHAFENSLGVQKIIMPNSIKWIGECTFSDMKNLKKVQLSKRVKYIGVLAFSNCKKLKQITIPASVKKIKWHAFGYCTRLEKVKFFKKSKLSAIAEGAFRGCKKLKTIKLPSGIKRLGEDVFWKCKSLKSIKIPKKVKTIGYGTFVYCKKLKKVYIPSNVKKIDESAFFLRTDKKRTVTIVTKKNSAAYKYAKKYKKRGFKLQLAK